MKDFICTHRNIILLMVAAMLGMMSLLLSWLNPLAALFASVSLGVVYLVSAVIALDRRPGSATAVRPPATTENQNRRNLRWKPSPLSGF